MRMVNANACFYFTILLIAFIYPSIYEDLEKLGMWEPLQDLLASPSDDMKVHALWVIGTAVQNNPAAQKAVRYYSSSLTHTEQHPKPLRVTLEPNTSLAPRVQRTDYSTSPSTPSPPFCPTSPPWPPRPSNSAPKRYTPSRAS
jgi:hypothetical protein